MKLIVTLGLAFIVAKLSHIHAEEDSKPEDIQGLPHYSIQIPNFAPNQQFIGIESAYKPPQFPLHDNNEHFNGHGGDGSHQVKPNGGNIPPGHPHESNNNWNSGGTPEYRPYITQDDEAYLERCYDGKEKSCKVEFHGYPKHSCGQYPWWTSSCKYFVIIAKNYHKEKATFYLSGLVDQAVLNNQEESNFGYVTVGISGDKKIGDDDIVECGVNGNGKVVTTHFYTDSSGQNRLKNEPDDIKTNGIKMLAFITAITNYNYQPSKLNLTCVFERPLKLRIPSYGNGNSYKSISLRKDKEFYVMLSGGHAAGISIGNRGQLFRSQKHDEPQISKSGDFAYNRNGCHRQQRPSNFLIASVILFIVILLRK